MKRCIFVMRALSSIENELSHLVLHGRYSKCCVAADVQPLNLTHHDVVSTERELWTISKPSENQLANMTYSSSCWVVYTTRRGEGFNLKAYEPKLI